MHNNIMILANFYLFCQFDLLSVELGSYQREGEESARRLEEQLVQATQRLQGYEKIERELDDIVLQSAQC